MPLRLPTADDLKELAAASHFRLTPEELTDFQTLIPGMFETLEALVPTLEGKTERQKNRHPARSLARACWVVARLGGWNCYYKPPGPITMHRGMQRFHAIHEGRMLAPTPE